MKIYYKSDFQIIEQFFDVNIEPIDITNIDIKLVYTTRHWEKYEVSKIGDIYTNCLLDSENTSKLYVFFKNHGLQPGPLVREITLFIDNVNFGGTQNAMLKPTTVIELVAKGGELGIGTSETLLLMQKGDKGDPFTYEDFTQEQIEELQRPAAEIGNTLLENEGTRQENETARIAAEGIRNTNEDTRQENETARIEAEGTRNTNEDTRQENETARIEAEGTRNTNEDTRQENETARGTAEGIRNTNESTRQENETARIAAESARNVSSNMFNVTVHVPLAEGYYTKETARAAVPTGIRKQGLIITYSTDASIWKKEQYIASNIEAWDADSSWLPLIDYATQAEAEAGTDEVKLMNAKQTKNSILYQLANATISALSTTVKNIIGAINEITGNYIEKPASSTDNAIMRFDGNNGKKAQNSTATIADDGTMTVYGKGTFQDNINILSTKYQHIAASPTADTVNDIRVKNSSGRLITERCAVANDTKGAGWWINESNGALRALFTSVPNSGCVYNSTTGYYEMNGITNLTEEQLRAAYPIVFNVLDFRGLMRYVQIRTNFPVQVLSYTDDRLNLSSFCLGSNIEVFAFRTEPSLGNKIYVSSLQNSFRFCPSLKKIIGVLDVSQVTNFAFSFLFLDKFEQVEMFGLKANIAFAQSPLLNLHTLQYMVTNRANGTTRITITVHATVWGYLNDAVGHPEWNALLVDAVNNQYIYFASA